MATDTMLANAEQSVDGAPAPPTGHKSSPPSILAHSPSIASMWSSGASTNVDTDDNCTEASLDTTTATSHATTHVATAHALTAHALPFTIAITVASYAALTVTALWAVLLWPLTLAAHWWYERHVVHMPRLHYAKNARNVSVLKRCDALKEPYRPTPYASFFPVLSGHLHTMLHEVIRTTPDMEFERMELTMEDGGLLCVDTYPCDLPVDAPVMLIVHGLTGGSHTNYVRHYTRALDLSGIRPVVMNARGCNDSVLKTPVYFHIGRTCDIRSTVKHLRKRYPDAPLMATAYSFGANLLTLYVGEEGADCPLVAAITCANPLDYTAIDRHLTRPVNQRVYNHILTRALMEFLRRHRHVFEDHEEVDMDEVLQSSTLREYDERITCKLWGFKSIEDYYANSSGKRVLHNIRIPFLVLQALDDPIIPEDVIPYRAFYQNPNLILATTRSGGHIAWLEGWRPAETNWCDRACVGFATSVIDHVLAARMEE